MSQRRILELEVIGNTRGFDAAWNRLNAGLTRTATGARSANRELSMTERQLMAIGTTARYALAGGLIFGITGAISRLSEMNSVLGETAGLMTDITSGGGVSAPSRGTIQQIGRDAIAMSNDLGIATNDVQQYMTRFWSSFNPTGGVQSRLQQMRAFVKEVAGLQVIFGAEAGDPQQLAGGIAGVVRNIDPSQKNIGGNTRRIANLIANLIAETPNITGRDVSRDIGRMGSVMGATGMTPEQVFASWGVAGASGGSASVIGRGLAQLLGTSLLRPLSPTNKQAYLASGLPTDPNALRQMGAFNVLLQLMRAVAPHGVRGRNLAALRDENIDDPQQAIQAAGVQGLNLTRVYQLFGRQESARQFINLLSQGGVKAMEKYIDSQKKATAANIAHVRQQEALKYRVLPRFEQARSNFGLTALQGIQWPLENLIARPFIGMESAANRHPRVTQAAEAAIAATLVGSALARRRGGAGLLSRLRGGAVASAALGVEAMPALLQGTHADGTRSSPLWVIIHPSSWALSGGKGLGSDVPGGKGWENRVLQRIRIAAPVAGGAAARFAPAALAGLAVPLGVATGVGALSYYTRGQGMSNRLSPLEQKLQSMPPAVRDGRVVIAPHGSMDVLLRMVDAQGRTIHTERQNGLPVKYWGAKSAPTSQGKTGKRGGG